MPTVFQIESQFMLLVWVVLMAVKTFAFVSSLLFSTEAYRAADKLTKPAWAAILGLGVACHVLFASPINILGLVFTVAAFVYLADVRPALSSLTRR